jgi:hypothetical protein
VVAADDSVGGTGASNLLRNDRRLTRFATRKSPSLGGNLVYARTNLTELGAVGRLDRAYQ